MSAARVAVIVPCFNDGATLTETLTSIREAFPVEIAVIDDASTAPATLEVLRTLEDGGVTVIRHERNEGLPAARNTGLRGTSTPLVFPLDADDLLEPGALGRLADRLDAMPEVAAAYGDYVEFGDLERTVATPPRLDPYRIAFRNEYPVSSLFRRSALEACGGWRAVGDDVGYEDWDLWMTFAERGWPALHAGGPPVYRRRLHGTRMLTDAGRRHQRLYATLRRTHPELFRALRAHRRATDLSAPRQLLYPLLYGGRPPSGVLRRARELAARRGQSPS